MQQKARKYIVFLADWGEEGPPEDVIAAIKECENLKLTVVWPNNKEAVQSVKDLAMEDRIEVPLTLIDEPILPLIYETRISSPITISFAYPEDVWDIIAVSQEKYNRKWQAQNQGLYLQSGIFADELIQGLKNMGINWVNILPEDMKDKLNRAYIKDDFLILLPEEKRFSNAKKALKYIKTRSNQIVVLLFNGRNTLTAEFLYEMNENMNSYEDTEIKMVTPGQLFNELNYAVPGAWDMTFNTDLTPWLSRPTMWYRLNNARDIIEEYRNSGQATIDFLETLKQEIYQLYRYELITNIQVKRDLKDEQFFQAGLSNIYRLTNRPIPAQINESLDYWPNTDNETSSFDIKSTPYYLRFRNSSATNGDIHIEKLSISLNRDNATYSVEIDTETPAIPFRIEIYMDLNNKRMAGLTRLLNETKNVFLEPDDAWEFAISIEGDTAYLYRFGRIKPKLIEEIKLEEPYVVKIPRSILKGNPLKWGYQAVVFTALKNDENNTEQLQWDISDFLCSEDKLRRRLLRRATRYLPAVRVN